MPGIDAERRSSPGSKPVVTVNTNQQDAFDKDDFDAISYINEMFPTENSLVGLDPLIVTLKQKIRRVDNEILAAVRQQSSSGSRARQDLGKAKQAIEELFGKINEIRRKAEQSEVMVQEICRDIKKLDYAKKHLTHTITALRRLAMLINAVDQLQRAVERGEYSEAAHLLEAVQQLSSHFQSFVQIPKVAELGGRLSTLQKSLQMNVMREFELLGTSEEKPNPLLLDRLRACCLVTDALGYKAREELIDYVCKKEMSVYTQIFSVTGETAQLDRAERRYTWMRKRLRAREEVWAIFPEAWRVPQLTCQMFCSLTKAQLGQILDYRAADLASNVESLLMAVKSTNDFEAEMAQRFGGAAAASSHEEAEEEEEAETGHGDDARPASQVRQRYEKMFKERQREGEASSAPGTPSDAAAAAAAAASNEARTAFRGSISSIFSKHLSVYVDAEEKALTDTMDTLVKNETWKPMEDAHQTNVLHSASELFAVIKKSLMRCSKFVSKGEAMLLMCNAFQRVIKAYAARLLARLPRTASGATSATAVAGASDWHVKVADGDLEVICTIVSTSEYCTEVVGALGRSIAKTVDAPYSDKVDMSEEEDEFQAVITACLSVLLLGLETRLDAAMTQMVRMGWATLEQVGDQSEFVNSFSKTLSETGPKLGSLLSDTHFRYLCDKLANSFTPRYYEYIFRCKKISEAGSQQLLLDTQAIKGLLLELPAAGRAEEAASASFSGFVTREMGRAEALLKVVGSRPENLVDNFFTLIPTGAAADFQRIIDLKVLRRAEQQALTENFNKRIGRAAPAAQFARPAGSPATSANSTQELASRFRFGANTAANRATAAASTATERMRESMAGSFAGSIAAMKNLNIGFTRKTDPTNG
ncbi:hypothetical protein WJX72_002419 [[Myrmecia] bisecta]|uniref:Vps53 N-terminal domain-containing protein n=1 Tax=[Myrmecia] bisecta TaxID=41462 RepID=A0AAW1Q3K4_9CHLO